MALSRAVNGVFIVAAKRTAFGTFGGKLKGMSATAMMEQASQAALAAGNVNPENVSSVIIGNVIQSSTDAIYLARHVGLRSGVPEAAPSLCVNRLCGSGFQAIINGAQEIMLGESEIVLAGGTESMSQAPFAVRDIRFGTTLGKPIQLEDTLWGGLTDTYTKMPMAITAENLAMQYNISREDCDTYALQSQARWKQAQDGGVFNAEIAPLTLKSKKGPETFSVDEHPRPQTNAQGLAKLNPVFKKDGVVTAGNASGVCDGAAAVIVASEEAVRKYNLTPLARLVAYGISGCDPKIMGIGPAPASRAALQAAGKSVDDMDIVEVNEAFAPQYLAVQKELGLNPELSNMNGGAIALGHPLAASGARITGHIAHELHRQGKKMGLGSACIGGGQGITVILEKA
ncbi:3-ketoacyl-CoA thiolase, mitochondrial-like [Mizuhopecten yessoensis]|uniref:3-ketoacyl-CoA thiolase, mitochondrial n=1 Tax=Mizuhopecten yessoensis TaxID=6573 RepID=A0A210QT53_MIZYE|nr:3-ketoacyl-CoA thiolase, mitochondrial-like [Mizuhopecten yessoensis]OWF51916.1 3-ketoacyl-CoA thiolase, mitochondrial [Mizuhopecten yessoensis]